MFKLNSMSAVIGLSGVLCLPGLSSAQSCPGPADIYYVNGVRNNFDTADTSRYRLAEVITQSTTVGCSTPSVFLNWNKSDGLSADLSQARQQLAEGVSINDSDLIDHLANYRRSIQSHRKVIVVAHSQGNLYANKAFDVLATDPIDINNAFSIVAVATPASFVAGQPSPCVDRCRYVTLFEDRVATFVFPLVNIGVLPWNTANALICQINSSCHNFVSDYLGGANSRSKLIGLIAASMPPPIVGSGVLTTLQPGQVAVVYFRTNPPFIDTVYGTSRTLTPDVLEVALGAFGPSGTPIVAVGNPTVTFTLFDGSTHLGSVTQNTVVPWADFKSSNSAFLGPATVVPFSSILGGTIDGKVEIAINQGSLTFRLGEAERGGSIFFNLFAPITVNGSSFEFGLESWHTITGVVVR